MAALNYLFSLKELYPPYRPDTTVLFVEELCREHGHNILWIFFTEDETVDSGEVEWSGGQAYVVKKIGGDALINKVFGKIRKTFVDMKFFSEALTGDWDFIQARDRYFAGVLGVIASRIKGVKFFFWVSFPFPEMYETRAQEGMSRYPVIDKGKAYVSGFFLYKIIARYADHLFVQSDQMKRDLIKKGVNPEKMTPVPMGISSREIRNFVNKFPRVPVKNRIVYLGTLARDRKLDFLVRVTKIVENQLGDIQMIFVGDGDEPGDREIIQQEAKKLNVTENIKITGKLPRAEAWEYVRNAAVCLSPFFPTPILNSTSPTKLIEYMALGSPVVANDHPEQSKLIKESGAGICVSWDEREFAEAIIQILSDEMLSTNMSEKGQKYAIEKRDYKNIANSLDKKYRELCAKELS